jgi:hypothetical protein
VVTLRGVLWLVMDCGYRSGGFVASYQSLVTFLDPSGDFVAKSLVTHRDRSGSFCLPRFARF